MIDYFNPRSGHTAPQRNRPWLWAIIDIGWMLAGTGLVILGSAAVGFEAAPLVLLVLTAAAVLARNTRRNRAMIAIGYLEQAARLNLPIPAMLLAAEANERGAMQRRLRRLRQAIEGGTPIGYAISRTLPGAPRRVVGMISSAERLGQLPRALARAVHQPRRPRQPAQTILLRWYPILMLAAIAAVGGFLPLFVFPKLQTLYHDLNLQLPAITLYVLAGTNAAAVPLMLVLAIVLFVFCGRMLTEALPHRRPVHHPWQVLTDRIAWHLPIWRRLVRNRGLADLCFVLHDATRAGQPLDRALADATEACANRVLARRVDRWSRKINAGIPLAEAARQGRLPRLIRGMLAPAQDSRTVEQVFGFLSRYYEGRYIAAASFINGAAIPVMVVIFGFFVASMALGVFVPMIHLADYLSMPKGLL